MAPGGCPWDREQTFESLRETILEEATELIDAINCGDRQKILEEVGDLLLNAVFVCKLGEKEEAFTTEEAIATLNAKLVRRHPHVFGDAKADTVDELKVLWAAVKKGERGEKSSAFDSIPAALPALSRAAKVSKILNFSKYDRVNCSGSSFADEETLGRHLLGVVIDAQQNGLDAEQALRKTLNNVENDFKIWEHAHEEKA